MFSKKWVPGFIVVFFCLNFGLHAVESDFVEKEDLVVSNTVAHKSSSRLIGSLNTIHNYYDYKLVSLENDELAKIKRITTGVLLSELPMPKRRFIIADELNLLYEIGEMFESGDAAQKEAALQFINYIMFYYKSDSETSGKQTHKIYFDAVYKLFLSEQGNLVDGLFDLVNSPNQDITFWRASYDFFIQYFFKNKVNAFDLDLLNRVVEIGLKKDDLFVKTCARILKGLETRKYVDWNSQTFDELKKDFLVKRAGRLSCDQSFYYRNYSNLRITAQDVPSIETFAQWCFGCDYSQSQYDALCLCENLVGNGFFSDEMTQGIEQALKRFKYKSFKYLPVFKAFVHLCNTAIDANVGIKNIIQIMGKIRLDLCEYDLNGELLEVCIKLVKYPSFSDAGMRLLQDYNKMGGVFSYGEPFEHFRNQLISCNVELRCNFNERIDQARVSMKKYNYVKGMTMYQGGSLLDTLASIECGCIENMSLLEGAQVFGIIFSNGYTRQNVVDFLSNSESDPKDKGSLLIRKSFRSKGLDVVLVLN